MTLALHLNMAAAALKESELHVAVSACNEALKLDARNVKALYRRAQAYAALVRWDEADEDLRFALEIEPNNKGVREEIQVGSWHLYLLLVF